MVPIVYLTLCKYDKNLMYIYISYFIRQGSLIINLSILPSETNFTIADTHKSESRISHSLIMNIGYFASRFSKSVSQVARVGGTLFSSDLVLQYII